MSLQGKTLFISGGSRGIGLAIALRAARDGANIAIAAKTAAADPRKAARNWRPGSPSAGECRRSRRLLSLLANRRAGMAACRRPRRNRAPRRCSGV